MIKYPHINVKLVGLDGNAFFIVGRCMGAMQKAGCTKEQIDEFRANATCGDYNHLLCVCNNYFNIN